MRNDHILCAKNEI